MQFPMQRFFFVLPVVSLLRCDAARLRVQRQKTGVVRTDYNLKLHNFQNVQYYSTFTLGGQGLPVIYDTGSFEILVLSEKCSTCAASLQKYDSAHSSTFHEGEAITAEHHFGSGSALSLKSLETVRLGPVDSPFFKASMPFWQIMKHEIPVWNENARFSGIIGLGHTDRIPKGFGDGEGDDQTLLAAMGIEQFAFCLGRQTTTSPGWLVVNPSIHDPQQFLTVPVKGENHWGVEMQDLSATGAYFNACSPSCGAIIDSGTSLIAAPASVLQQLNPLLKSIKEDCSNLNDLPSLSFLLGGQTFWLPPKAYVMQVHDQGNSGASIWDMLWGGETKSRTTCVPAFMNIEKSSQFGPVIILGMPFLRYHYTVFDRKQKALFIAEATPECNPAPRSLFFPTINGTSSAAKSSSRAFAAVDYEPLQVDVAAMRAPDWAFSNATKDMGRL